MYMNPMARTHGSRESPGPGSVTQLKSREFPARLERPGDRGRAVTLRRLTAARTAR